MTYRRNYRYRPQKRLGSAKRAAIEHVQAYRNLEHNLGPVVPAIKNEFVKLDSGSLEKFFIEYERQYGAKAASYAKCTLPKWRNGTTKMSGQTAERIINLVPPYLSTSKRYDLVKTLCQYHRNKHYRSVLVDPRDLSATESRIRSELKYFTELAAQENLPDRVFESINWMNNYDIVVARKMVTEIQKKETETINKAVTGQTPKILNLIARKQVDGYSESFNFPNGQLLVIFQKQQPCFVATAVYNDPNHPDVGALRAYRDDKLRGSIYGRAFIRCYWTYGPLGATWISRRPHFQRCLHAILTILIPRIFRNYYE